MNSLAAVSFFVVVAVANAGVLRYDAPLLETRSIWEGPLVRSTILEADGVGFTSTIEGGAIATTRDLTLAVPEVVVARAEPAILPVPIVPSVPVLEHGRSDIIAGPSGTIIANKDYNLAPIAPALKEIYVEPAVRTILPTHGLTYGKSLYRDNFFGYGGLHGYGGRSLLW